MNSPNIIKVKKSKRKSLEIFGDMLSTFKNRSESDLPKTKPTLETFPSQNTVTNDEDQILYSEKIISIQENVTQFIFSRKTIVILTIYHNYIKETALNGTLLATISSNLTFALSPSSNSGFNLILKGLNEDAMEITRNFRVKNEAELTSWCNYLTETTHTKAKTVPSTNVVDIEEENHEQYQRGLFWKESSDLMKVCGDNLDQLINENDESTRELQNLLNKMGMMH
jgi:hypothetical protein